jgi:hypothetical protein
MDVLFDLSVLAGVIAIFLLLAVWASAAGTDSRPGFGQDDPRFPEHHNSIGGSF